MHGESPSVDNQELPLTKDSLTVFSLDDYKRPMDSKAANKSLLSKLWREPLVDNGCTRLVRDILKTIKPLSKPTVLIFICTIPVMIDNLAL